MTQEDRHAKASEAWYQGVIMLRGKSQISDVAQVEASPGGGAYSFTRH